MGIGRTILLGGALLAAACGGDPGGADGSDAGPGDGGPGDGGACALGTVSAAALHDELAHKDFLLINVHVPRSDGVLPGTDTSIPYTDVDALAAYLGADRQRKAVLTCLGGPMSHAAGTALAARGYCNLRELQGGMNAWTAAGYQLDP